MRDLPDHVWSYVFGQFEYPAGKSSFATEVQFDGPGAEGLATLSRLCRTSSRFLRLARRVLYRSLPLANWKIRNRLLSTLHRHPNLAQYVEKVDLGEGVFSRDEITSLLLPHYNDNGDGAQSRPDGLESFLRGLLDGPEWPDAVPDVWFAHCATILPNLKLLEYATRNEGTFLQAVIRQAAVGAEASGPGRGPQSLTEEPRRHSPSQLHQPLSRLEEFRISNQDTEFAVRLQSIQQVFFLPRLKTFRGWAVDLDTTMAAADASQRQGALRHAYFEYSLAEADGISDLLRTCPFLQTLKISWGSGTVGDSYLNFDDIGTVLREHGTGLEVLDLDCRECISYDMGESEGSLGSLGSLQRLKHLALPEAILLGDEDLLGGMDKVGDGSDDASNDAEADPISTESLERLLPDGLETLRLYSGYDEEAWVRDSVQGVLTSRRLGRLNKVRLDFATEVDEEWDLDGWGSESGVDHCVFHR